MRARPQRTAPRKPAYRASTRLGTWHFTPISLQRSPAGDIQSGLEHYLKSGRQEGRFPSPNYQVPLDVPAIEVEVTVEPDLAATLLAHVEQTWNRLGQEQPHWSVLSADQFKPDRIAEHEDDFYASGAADTNMLLAVLRRNGFAPERFARVLEYGCGLGRVTAHLASAFPAVIACDISQSHLLQAKQTLARTGTTNAEFRLVSLPEFGMHNSFDLWFSRIVLQHNPPPVIAMILGTGARLLSAGSVWRFFRCRPTLSVIVLGLTSICAVSAKKAKSRCTFSPSEPFCKLRSRLGVFCSSFGRTFIQPAIPRYGYQICLLSGSLHK